MEQKKIKQVVEVKSLNELKIGDVVEVKFKDGEIYKGYVDKDENEEKMLVLLDKDEAGKWKGHPYWDIDCEWIKIIGKSKFILFKNIIENIAQDASLKEKKQ